MRLRSLAALAAAGLFVVPAFADQPKPTPAPVIPTRTIAPPKPCEAASPAKVTLPSPLYLEQPPHHFAEWSELRKLRDDFHRYWMNNPSETMTYERPVLKTYAVGDLVVPQSGEKSKTLEKELIKKITATVRPKSWAGAGGNGTMEYFPLGLALVVNQSHDVHEAVEQFLEHLRKFQEHQIAVELCIVKVSDGWMEKCELAKQCCPCEGDCATQATRTRVISADAVTKLLRLAKQEEAISALAAPRLTTFNGQCACVAIGEMERFVTSFSVKSVDGNLIYVPKCEDHEMGIRLNVEPTITNDGKVHLSLTGTVREHAVLPVPMTPLTTVVPPIPDKGKRGEPVPFTQFIQEPKIIARTVTDTVAVPDGGCAVFYGGKGTIEETVKEGLPTLSDVPVVAELFARDRKITSTNHLLVVVTPRIIKPEVVVQCEAKCPADGKLSGLLADYHRACRAGKVEEARRLAIECLAINPTCFGAK